MLEILEATSLFEWKTVLLLFLYSATILMRSTKTQHLPLASPRKTTPRKSSSTTSLRSVSPLKHPSKASSKNQSVSGLVSSFRKLSVTPSPYPPSRSKSTSPRKPKSSHARGFSSVSVSSVEDIVNLIKDDKCKNIIVMAGAGISTPSGIPDFRYLWSFLKVLCQKALSRSFPF